MDQSEREKRVTEQRSETERMLLSVPHQKLTINRSRWPPFIYVQTLVFFSDRRFFPLFFYGRNVRVDIERTWSRLCWFIFFYFYEYEIEYHKWNLLGNIFLGLTVFHVHWVPLGCTEFHRVPPSSTRFNWVSLGSTRFCSVLLGSTRSCLV